MNVIVNAFGVPGRAARYEAAIGRLMAAHERRAGHRPKLPISAAELELRKKTVPRGYRDTGIMGALIAAVAAEPGRRPTHYAKVVGISRHKSQQRLSRLADDGRLRREKRGDHSGAPVHYWPVGGGAG